MGNMGKIGKGEKEKLCRNRFDKLTTGIKKSWDTLRKNRRTLKKETRTLKKSECTFGANFHHPAWSATTPGQAKPQRHENGKNPKSTYAKATVDKPEKRNPKQIQITEERNSKRDAGQAEDRVQRIA
jgi:hypothetical protein